MFMEVRFSSDAPFLGLFHRTKNLDRALGAKLGCYSKNSMAHGFFFGSWPYMSTRPS